MSNISPNVKAYISIKPDTIEEISTGEICSPGEVTLYKSMSPEYRDISMWPYFEMSDISPSIMEYHIDMWHDAYQVRKKHH